ncbi:MAG: hypothetical protein IPO07_25115 [Haliscomenobacter sp.]|nr:hypothetical protein [Haliscomenobacter sp.]MBK9491711.1 hypothetical protein [Haliscomenobacter sp.]
MSTYRLGVVALIGADHLSDLIVWTPFGRLVQYLDGHSVVGLFYGVNLLGLKPSAQTQNFMTVPKSGLDPHPDFHPFLLAW